MVWLMVVCGMVCVVLTESRASFYIEMDIILGLVGKDYVMTVADRAQARSIVVFKHDEDKIFELDGHMVMATAGPQGDRANFAEYIQRNIQLYKYRNDLPLTTKGAANFTRYRLPILHMVSMTVMMFGKGFLATNSLSP